MELFLESLKAHANTHPELTARDIVKFTYQSTFGCSHFAKDLETAKKEISHERNTRYEDIPLFEETGDYCRLNLNSKFASELDSGLIAKMFFASAKTSYGSADDFERRISALKDLPLPAAFEEIRKEAEAVRNSGYAPVGHSEKYRSLYHPSYRLIDSDYKRFFDVISELYRRKKGVIAIDGPCGSGKSTAAEKLSRIFDCNIIHTDDFFLPPDLRTEKRRSEAGGNIHYERFVDEVINGLESGNEFSYSVYDCSVGGFSTKKRVVPKPYTIIEGVYSLRPDFRSSIDLSVFLTVTEEEQERRIRGRNGEENWKKFRDLWIVLENRYFEYFNIEKNADYVIK